MQTFTPTVKGISSDSIPSFLVVVVGIWVREKQFYIKKNLCKMIWTCF